MSIFVERPMVGMRGKRAAYFVARTSNGPNALEICRGAPGETAANVKARAIHLLAQAAEQRVLSVRMALPGTNGPADTWVLQGDPVFGFEYGRMSRPDTRFGGMCLFKAASAGDALIQMLTHMADMYPANQWHQFLWGAVNVDVIRQEITARNAARARAVVCE